MIVQQHAEVLRACSDTIVNLKTMWEQTQGGKYTSALHEDVSKLLPAFKKDHVHIEKLVTKADEVEDAMYYAIAHKLDSNYERYNELSDWYAKLFPRSKKAKKA